MDKDQTKEPIKNTDSQNASQKQTMLSPEFIKQIVTNNKTLYETELMLVIVSSYGFWNKYCKDIINIGGVMSSKFHDFSKPIDNIIYNEINNIYSGLSSGIDENGNEMRISREFLLSIFAAKVHSGKMLEQDFRLAEFRINEIYSSKPESQMDYEHSIKAIVEEGFNLFIDQRRVAQLIAAGAKYKNLDTAQIMEQFTYVMGTVEKIKEAKENDPTKNLEGFSESMYLDIEENLGQRIPISTLPILTKTLGGGILKGETGLVIATSGGGKTVFACQFAMGVALNGFKTLYITTEQLSTFLIPRMLSSTANIPFNKIKDGYLKAVKAKQLTKDEISRAEEVVDMIGDTLKFANWCKDGRKLETDLESLIKQKIKEWGSLDCIIVDWLGGGLDIPVEDYDKRFAYYMHCVNRIKDLAIKYNVSFLLLAQANKKKVDGRLKLDVDCIDGCNTMDQPITWAAGISAVTEGGKSKVNSLQETYLRKQCINVWKGRMNGAYAYPVYREFEFQRFIEKDSVELLGDADAHARKIDLAALDNSGIVSV